MNESPMIDKLYQINDKNADTSTKNHQWKSEKRLTQPDSSKYCKTFDSHENIRYLSNIFICMIFLVLSLIIKTCFYLADRE